MTCELGDELDVGYQPFIMEGLVSVSDQSLDQVKVTVLRDTGAMQSFIVAGRSQNRLSVVPMC